MKRTFASRRRWAAALLAAVFLFPACASRHDTEVRKPEPYDPRVERPSTERAESGRHPATTRDKTAKGAAIGAATGAAGALVIGKREADQILIGAAIGAVAGAGVGAYLDAQERKLAEIPGTTVERVDRETLLLRFDSDILFALNSDRPTPESLVTLGEVGDVLVQYPKTAVVVQGHTDSTGSEQHNLELSERRAHAVKDLLVDRGVDDDRVAAIGNGELYPVASNGFEEGRRRNRRVTILLKSRG
jgi:outer membrane protein OmpA-like peptidoglycan-associated protein